MSRGAPDPDRGAGSARPRASSGAPGRAALGIALAVGAAIAAVLVARLGCRPSASPRLAAARTADSAAPAVAGIARAAAAIAPSAREVPAALPASLDGTDADGDVRADASGHLVVDLELRRLFDHFLSASGEEPLATLRARIVAVLRARLPATAAAEAIAILDQYLAYREAARALAPAADPTAGLDQVHELRARMFAPAVVQAFFADEEAATYAALARRTVQEDESLSPAERAHRLAELDARTPAAVQKARAAATAPIDEMAREAQMRAAGASADQITAARTAAMGAEAAGRLAALDRAHAAWDSRLAAFRAERAALLADAALDDAERRRRIDDLLARSFTEPERIRVEALDRIAASPSASPSMR
ncbi:MAG TPA: lipase secretion chaperone [Kofleriaceae bacterium]|nr:lipase secretion chaperone [Kofleriaceae bacterium]